MLRLRQFTVKKEDYLRFRENTQSQKETHEVESIDLRYRNDDIDGGG